MVHYGCVGVYVCGSCTGCDNPGPRAWVGGGGTAVHPSMHTHATTVGASRAGPTHLARAGGAHGAATTLQVQRGRQRQHAAVRKGRDDQAAVVALVLVPVREGAVGLLDIHDAKLPLVLAVVQAELGQPLEVGDAARVRLQHGDGEE
jgi:hypothetical protein